MFTTQITCDNEQKMKVKISRTQLPIQPAFAVTGHSAEGKTLPNVLSNLNKGGFAGYVTASHARTCHGLFIAEPVNLNDLNKPILFTLLQESNQLHALQHNTLIKYGFKDGAYEKISDPKSKKNMTNTALITNFTGNTNSKSLSTSKCHPLSFNHQN